MDAPFRVRVGGKPRHTCSVAGCGREHWGLGFCARHYVRVKKYGDPSALFAAEKGTGSINNYGYRSISVPGHANASKQGRVLEHRFVMSKMLGRPLRGDETVHHKNGVRLDNREENLELWLLGGYQTPGQRVSDLVAWARALLTKYGEEF